MEQRLTDYAQKTGHILITGHTHRPRLSIEAPYFNTGSCVHPRCITCLEILGDKLTLVKWASDTRRDNTLYVGREVLSQIKL